jgi:hypothetical protein
MEEIFEIRFANNEKHFINSCGVNRGYVEASTKVVRHYFLSDKARSLYHLLDSYARHNEHRICYPGRTRIRAELGGCSDKKLTSAINELVEKGYIITQPRDGYTTLYLVNELHKIPDVHHSEYVHSLRQKYSSELKQNKFYDALEKYKKSELFELVNKLKDPLDLKDEIAAFFDKEILGIETPVIEKEEEMAVPPNEPKPTILTNVVPVTPDGKEKDPYSDKPKREKKDNKDFESVNVSDWNTYHFLYYFEHLWIQKRKLPYPFKWKEDLGAMKHVINQIGDKETVKRLIDLYFTLDDLEQSKLSVHNFSSAYIQQKLRSHLNSDFSNSYKTNSGKKSIDPDVDEEWLKQFLED